MGYFISYRTVDSRTVSNTTTSYNISSVVISGLRVGEKYGVTVACETEAGAGPASDIVYEPGKNIHVYVHRHSIHVPLHNKKMYFKHKSHSNLHNL